jgi:acyl-CoA thioesterase
MTDLAQALALTPAGSGRWTAELTPDWTQGRTAYGGLVAGWAVAAAAGEIEGTPPATGRPVRTLDVAYVAPMPPGPLAVTLTPLAVGGSTSSLQVDVHRPDGALGARVLLTCGASRPSDVVVAAAPGETPPDLSAGVDFGHVPGLTPEFLQHLEMRWCGDSVPFTGTGPEGARVRAWIRHRGPGVVSGLPAVVSLLDATPPTVLPMMRQARNASTARWGVHLLRELPPAAAADWFWFEADTLHAAAGYAVEVLRVFHAGELVAWSEQLVAVFDRPRGG